MVHRENVGWPRALWGLNPFANATTFSWFWTLHSHPHTRNALLYTSRFSVVFAKKNEK